MDVVYDTGVLRLALAQWSCRKKLHRWQAWTAVVVLSHGMLQPEQLTCWPSL